MAWRAVREAVARHRELALAIVFAAMVGWELLEVAALDVPRGRPGPLVLGLHAVQVLLVLGITWVVVRAWQEKTRHEEALARMVEKVVMAQEEERRRIAYDVHDGIAQLVVSAKQHVETCRDLLGADPDRAARELALTGERLERAIVETRRVLMALRPSAVDSLGLVEAVRRSLDDAARELGWSIRFSEDLGDERLPPAVETAVFRILQEALANAQRHAEGQNLAVDLRRAGDWLQLEVRDDGIGFAVDSEARARGLGLSGMRERARLLGGTCRIESRPGRGTSVSLRLPLPGPDRDGSAG
jgi:signal transduction histidine kinase